MSLKIAIIENHIIATNTIRYKLTRVLVDMGFDVRVLTTGPANELKQARDNGFHITDIGTSNKNPLEIARYIHRLRRELQSFRPDVCLTFTIRPAIWGNLVTSGLQIPTITNITGIGPLFASDHLVYRAARLLYRFVLRKTKRIFFQNNDDMELFLKKGFVDPERVRRIPGSGIDHEHYSPRPFPPHKHRLAFLFIGRLVKDKGILEFVQAAALLKTKIPDIRFQVLGPIWTQNLKDNVVTRVEVEQWEKDGTIEYLGVTPDVRPYIAAADCLVLPSYREGTSNVLLEACSMERPGITCDTTGCREIIEDGLTGFLCQVADAEDLAEKIFTMASLDEESRRRMGRAAREKVIREFDKQIVVDAYLEAIREACSRRQIP